MIFFDQKQRRHLYTRTAAVFIAIVIAYLLYTFINHFAVALRDRPTDVNYNTAEEYRYYYSPVNRKKIALTFDDGPHPTHTEQIATVLREKNAPATFFFLSQSAIQYPDIVRSIALNDDEVEIGNHTFSHSQKVHSSKTRLLWELRTSKMILETLGQKEIIFYRPPFLYNIGVDPTINPFTSPEDPLLWGLEEGYIPVGVDVDSRDWEVETTKEIVDNTMRGILRGGKIVLLHDALHVTTNKTVDAVPIIIDEVRKAGYEIVPLRELLIPPDPVVLHHDLKPGTAENAAEVSLLQWFLYRTGFLDESYLTGIFDEHTSVALKSFQLAHAIVAKNGVDDPEFGMAGERTRAAIEKNTYTDGHRSAVQQVKYPKSRTLASDVSFSIFLSVFPVFAQIVRFLLLLVIIKMVLILAGFLWSLIKGGRHIQPYHGGVTILIPAYNEEENIESSILSVVHNSYPKKEIIVINDGSTDRTRDIALSVKARFPHLIRLIDVPNGGKAHALNVGIKEAIYDVFVAIDADTVLEHTALAHLVRHFSDETVVAVSGKVKAAASFNPINFLQSIEYIVGQNIDKRTFALFNGVSVVPGPIGAWRKSAVMRAGGYGTDTLVEDQDLTLALLMAGGKVLYEGNAVAYTETPHTLRDFIKQRSRWIYGTLQCIWKYKSCFVKKPLSSLSLFIMPNNILFNSIIPLIYPIFDVLFLAALIFGLWHHALLTYLSFTVFDMIYVGVSFIIERERLYLILLVPIQRLVYRPLISYLVITSLVRVIEGKEAGWNKVRKIGTAKEYFSDILHRVSL